jgi:hypothetical protein
MVDVESFIIPYPQQSVYDNLLARNFECSSNLLVADEQLAPSDVLRVKSPLLRAFPWHTGVVLELPNFLGNVGDDNLMGVRQNLICNRLSNSFKNQGFLSTLDKCETTILFTTGACGNPQDHDVQSMLGIKVTSVDNTRQTVSSLPNVLVESLGSSGAGFLFSLLARYRLVDVVALMEGVCPNSTPIPRSPAPKGSIPVRFLMLLHCSPV